MSKNPPTYPASTVARLLMLPRRRLVELAKAGRIPRCADGRYELAPAVQGYIRHVHSRFGGADRDNATHAEVAQHLCLERQRVGELLAKGILPRSRSGRLNIDQCREAYLRHLREVAAGRGDGNSLDLATERARKAKEEADRLEMQNAQRREDLLKREDVEAWIAAAFSRVRSKLGGLPAKLAPVVAATSEPRGAEAAVRTALHEALDELADTTDEDLEGDGEGSPGAMDRIDGKALDELD